MKALARAAGILLVGVVGLEIGLRLVLGLGSPPLLTAHPDIGYLFQADQDLTRFTNRVHINGYHQRSDDMQVADSSRVARVLFLGDSITWGGVLTDQQKTYPELFENRLGPWCEAPAETLNASAGSWGVGNLRAYAEEFGFFGSDLVVLQIGQGDLTQPTSDSSSVGSRSMPRHPPPLALTELVQRYLWPRLRSRVNQWFSENVREASTSPIHRASVSRADRSQFETNMKHLGALVERIRKRRMPVAVLYVPERGSVLPGGGSPPALYDRFRDWIDRHGVPIVDLQARWDGLPNVKSYYRDYIHPNERGNQAIAESLSEVVEAERLPVCPQ